MKRFITVLVISCLLVLIIPSLDYYYLSQGNLFGLWTGLFGAFVGATLILIGLVFVLFSGVIIFFKKPLAKNISLNGLSIIGIGILTALSTTIFWFILGQPMLTL